MSFVKEILFAATHIFVFCAISYLGKGKMCKVKHGTETIKWYTSKWDDHVAMKW